jgi:ubiquinone/menaquinone biosynthesis C-methylase UbiE
VQGKYVGQTAVDYDLVRAGRKWDAEHDAVEQLLAFVAEGSTVLDIPVGTGRLFRFFNARGFDVCGADISTDMLEQARTTADVCGGRIRLERADIRRLTFREDSFDLVVCLRFLNMIDSAELELALREMSRVSRGKLLIGIRYVTPYSDLQFTAWDLARLMARPVRAARWLFHRVFEKRYDVVAHDKNLLRELLNRLGLTIIQKRYVERRWDSTDYVMWLLQVPGSFGR